jgi:hypothetical protein
MVMCLSKLQTLIRHIYPMSIHYFNSSKPLSYCLNILVLTQFDVNENNGAIKLHHTFRQSMNNVKKSLNAVSTVITAKPF